jgi:hypothetical protein
MSRWDSIYSYLLNLIMTCLGVCVCVCVCVLGLGFRVLGLGSERARSAREVLVCASFGIWMGSESFALNVDSVVVDTELRFRCE